MPTQKEKCEAFKSLHKQGAPFVFPNPWDAGSARILESAGAKALATTSSGFALTKGRRDYAVTRLEVLEHCRDLAHAVDIPVAADLENGFADEPHEVAETIKLAIETGLAGGSIEDWTRNPDKPLYDQNEATERLVAAAYEAKKSKTGFVLTARTEAYLHGDPKLNDVINRLQQFEASGADVLFAPGLPDMDAVRAVCSSVSLPVNILLYGKLVRHTLEEFAEAGVARISIGGGLAWAAYAQLAGVKDMLANGRFDLISSIDRNAAKLVSGALKSD
ncbi:MAG: isocitrate lyase/phosphoenolpyruvate mutase family protein [Marinicaulis sp.]|nr:isocitrate lyase/phosphoenolpyruvate mutase family protein [Marinicaulis sp.]NNL90441.1 isocitrate lyase/phosphoenolpyruvate mutase family protein [Marinicaulis sp.]